MINGIAAAKQVERELIESPATPSQQNARLAMWIVAIQETEPGRQRLIGIDSMHSGSGQVNASMRRENPNHTIDKTHALIAKGTAHGLRIIA